MRVSHEGERVNGARMQEKRNRDPPHWLDPFVPHFGGLIAEHDIPETSLLHRRQSVDIAGQEPTAIGLFAVYSDTMSGELRRFPAGALGHGQRIPAACVSDFTYNHDFFQLAGTTYPHPLMGGRKGGGESIPTKRRLPRIYKHDIVRH